MQVAVPEREGAVVHLLAPEAASVPEARRLATEFAGGRLSDAQCNKLGVAITEVVANSVRHSGSDEEIRMVLTVKADHLCVRVTDGGAGLVPKPGAMSTDPGAGYGLFLVEQLTRRWGMTREEGRTRVWFELGYADDLQDAPAVADAPCD